MKLFHSVIIALSVVFYSCRETSFIEGAGNNQFSLEDEYVSCVNIPNKIVSLTFGDFTFASNKRTWRKMSGNQKLPYNNVLLYAQTKNPDYDYYIVIDSVSEPDSGYTSIPKYIHGKYIYFIISDNAPANDVEFIYEGIFAL